MDDLLDILAGVIFRPRDAFRDIQTRPMFFWAIMTLVVVQVPKAFAQFALLPEDVEIDILLASGENLIYSFGSFLVMSLFLYGFSRVLGGYSRWTELFQGLAFAHLPGVLVAPVFIVAIISQADLTFVVGWVFNITELWRILLYVLVIKEMNNFSTIRALITIVLSFIAVTLAELILSYIMNPEAFQPILEE